MGMITTIDCLSDLSVLVNVDEYLLVASVKPSRAGHTQKSASSAPLDAGSVGKHFAIVVENEVFFCSSNHIPAAFPT